MIRTLLRAAACTIGLAAAAGAQHAKKTCFIGAVRPQCAGFVIFETSAFASAAVPDNRFLVVYPVFNGTPQTVETHVRDLPSYASATLGYLRVVDSTRAVGVVGEFGYGNRSQYGNGNIRRFSLEARQRREIGNATVDLSAGPMVVDVFVPSTNCCDRAHAYGLTAEGGISYHDYIGVVGGVDLVHGGGRTSSAVRVGIRTGSWAAVVTSAVVGIGAFLVIAALASGT